MPCFAVVICAVSKTRTRYAAPCFCNAPSLDVEATLRAVWVDEECQARLSDPGPPVPITAFVS